ncbi:MAG: type I restriction endonuclease subunit R [Blastocatellia bacterium]
MTLDTSSSPLFLEEHASRIPALQLLQNLGYVFLRPQDAHLERKGKLSNVLLEGVLDGQLRRLNRIRYKGREREFSDANIRAAIDALKNAPLAGGLMAASQHVYDLLSLGKTLEQTIDGDTKSYTINFVDWLRPERNLFHVVEEFEVQTQAGRDARAPRRTPDVVLFVNGIPFAVIECKRPDEKNAIEEAISQQLRNQHHDHIPLLFVYAQLLLAVNGNEAAYGTTGTKAKFWSRWLEPGVESEITRLANRPLTRQQKENLYAGRSYLRQYFDEMEMEDRPATGQDAALYCLCRPDRLIELSRQFILFEDDAKNIARHQQYFAVKKAIERIKKTDETGRRTGGVIWHAQGSGKFLTLVLLAKAIVLDPGFPDPRIVIVSDRGDLDSQVRGALKSRGKEPVRATTGRHLLELLSENRAAVITTASDKFETAVKGPGHHNDSADIFVLMDESHRSPYGESLARMRRALPQACYIGFTGAPLKKQDRDTAETFGGIIDAYTIDQALRDRAVVPLLYESRRLARYAGARAVAAWLERMTKPLASSQRSDLKKKIAPAKFPDLAEQRIRAIAWDIGEHFSKNVVPPFKAQLVTESKPDALKYKEFLDEFGQVTSEVSISDAGTREGVEAAANAYLKSDDPKLLIVVDESLTGFDAPQNAVLYLDKNLEGHALLQTITRAGRVREGKEFGYVLDYSGAFSERAEALDLFGSLPDFASEDLEGVLADISEESAKLPDRHSELWNIFKEPGDREDGEAFERLLGREDTRERFYEKFSAFNRTMSVAFSSVKFFHDTAGELVERYKQDLLFFERLRIRVQRRYADESDFGEYEAGLQKLIEAHVSADEAPQATPLINIFDRENFEAEVEKLESTFSKADTIANRTRKAIAERMEEDPFFYRRFARMLADVTEEWREGRINDAAYLNRVIEVMNAVRDRTGDDLPPELRQHDAAIAIYGAVSNVFRGLSSPPPDARKIATEAALEIDRLVRENRVVDWLSNLDVQNEIRNRIDDYLYELKERYDIDLRLDEMDAIIEGALDIAKTRYA